MLLVGSKEGYKLPEMILKLAHTTVIESMVAAVMRSKRYFSLIQIELSLFQNISTARAIRHVPALRESERAMAFALMSEIGRQPAGQTRYSTMFSGWKSMDTARKPLVVPMHLYKRWHWFRWQFERWFQLCMTFKQILKIPSERTILTPLPSNPSLFFLRTNGNCIKELSNKVLISAVPLTGKMELNHILQLKNIFLASVCPPQMRSIEVLDKH